MFTFKLCEMVSQFISEPYVLPVRYMIIKPHLKTPLFSEGFTVQSKFIGMFSSFVDLEKFATKSMDSELLGKIKIVKTYNHNLPLLIRKIDSKCVRDERRAGKLWSISYMNQNHSFVIKSLIVSRNMTS